MKDYNEMARGVLERRDRYEARRRARRSAALKLAAAAACVCLIVGYAVGSYSRSQVPAVELPGVEDYRGSQKVSEPLEWFSEAELPQQDDGSASMGVYIPTFTAYRGGFYSHGGESAKEDRFALMEEDLLFSLEYQHRAYLVQDKPDCVAIRLNGKMQVYEKQFDVAFELNGMRYGIAYAPGSACEPGEKVLEGEGFTVYRTEEEGTYLVNILPLLKTNWPELFGDDQTYKEAWQVALALGPAVEDTPVVENPGSTGTLVPFEAVWGGSYTDEAGRMVIWLTENTHENQEEVFARNPGLDRESTMFRTADYSRVYLEGVLAEISEGMRNGELHFVSSAALLDSENRLEVRMAAQDAAGREKVLAYDPMGGAIEIKVSAGMTVEDMLAVAE